MPRAFVFALVAIALPPIGAAAQPALAARIAEVPNGVVRMQYDARPGVCGDGGDLVGFRHSLTSDSFESYGTWRNARCVTGPLRVSLVVADRRPVSVRTRVGGAWPAEPETVTDLGVVSSRDAAAYFLSVVPALDGSGRRGRILLPAVLAADGIVVPGLLALARDSARSDDTRRQAVQWAGQLGDASVVPALIELARTGGAVVRQAAVFSLGQTGDPRAFAALHALIEDPRENERIRAHAIFSLAHGDPTNPAELAYLRGVFPRLETTRLKEAVFQGEAEAETDGGRWLLARARDAREATPVRRSALFWAGQSEATPTADLVAAYRDLDDPGLREHAIFVLSQRDDEAALDALIRIAREDGDRRMRGRALFWLAQKKDERATKLIADLLAR